MKKIATALAVPAMALGLAACGASSHAGEVTPQASAAASVALGEAQGCLQQGSFLTHGGRMKIKTCVESLVPADQRSAAETCAIKGLLTSHGHAGRENALAHCLSLYNASTASPSAS